MCSYLLQKCGCVSVWNCKLSTFLLLISMIVTPVIGLLMDLIGYTQRIMVVFYGLLLVLLGIYVYRPLALDVLIICSIIISSLELLGAPIINTFFKKEYRCLGTSLAYSSASFVFSSTVPIMSVLMERMIGSEKGIFFYPAIMCVLGLTGLLIPHAFHKVSKRMYLS